MDNKRANEFEKEILTLRQKFEELEQAEMKRSLLLDELQKTQELFNQFMGNSPIYIFFKDENLRSIRLSRNYENMLERPIHELLGKTMDEVFPSYLAKSMMADDQKILNSGQKIIVEEELNGRTYTTVKFPIEYKGKPRYLAGYTIDITEQKRAEKALIDSEEKFRTVFYICPDPVCINRLNDGAFIAVNRAFIKYTGYIETDVIGKTTSECKIWKNIDDRQRFIDELEKSGEVINYEAMFCTKGGKIIHGLLSASIIEINGHRCIISITRDITKYIETEKQLEESLRQLRLAMGTTIQVLISAVERKDKYTAGHQRQMADLARAIATEMCLPKKRIEGIRLAAIIHDIGKLSVPAEILNKPGKLSELEFSLLKEHARSGYDILKDVVSPWPLADIVHQHHERLDGSGYPNGLKGEEIILEARILAVADVVEAMCSHRPYRPAPGIDAALEEIEKNKGRLYDSEVSDHCLRLFKEKKYHFRSSNE